MRNKISSAEIEESAQILLRFNREQLHHIARKGHDRPLDDGFLGLSQREIASYSIETAARKKMGGALVIFDGLESECDRELQKQFGPAFSGMSFFVPRDVSHSRSMATTPGEKGGFLVGTTIFSFIDQIQHASVCFELGAQLLSHHAASNILVAKQLTGPTFTWLGPSGSSVTASDPSFGQLSATPKTIVSVTEISAQAQFQMGPVSEHFTRRNLALGLAAGAEDAMLVGTGGAQPLGIVNTPGINTVAGAGLDRAKVIDMQTKATVQSAIVTRAAQGYATTPTVATLLAGRQEFTGVASTLWGGSVAKGQMVGAPAMSTEAMTAGSLVFGDFSQLLLVEFSPMQIAVNHADFNKGTLAVRALWMVDVLLAEPKSFTLASSVT